VKFLTLFQERGDILQHPTFYHNALSDPNQLPNSTVYLCSCSPLCISHIRSCSRDRLLLTKRDDARRQGDTVRLDMIPSSYCTPYNIKVI